MRESITTMDAKIVFLINSVRNSTVVRGTTNEVIYTISMTEDEVISLTDIHGTVVGQYEVKYLSSSKVTVRGETKTIQEFLPGSILFDW